MGFKKFFIVAKQKPVLSSAVIVTLIFCVFHLPFYNRIYTFLDIFLIIPGALGVLTLKTFFSSYGKMISKISLVIICAVVSIPLIYIETTHTASLDSKTEEALLSLSRIPPNSVIITSPELLPWVQGWSLGKVNAPGNLKEPHQLQEWYTYWAHTNVQFENQFLMSFPQPLYLFAGGHDTKYLTTCSTPLHLYLYEIHPCK
jgi:hypothetical protein